MFNPEKPYNKLSFLPPGIELETKAVLKQAAKAGAALAELKGYAGLLPDKQLLIDSIVLQEAKDSSAIENIVKKPYVRINDIIAAKLASRNIASGYLKKLEEIKLLKPHKTGRDVLFENVALVNILKNG